MRGRPIAFPSRLRALLRSLQPWISGPSLSLPAAGQELGGPLGSGGSCRLGAGHPTELHTKRHQSLRHNLAECPTQLPISIVVMPGATGRPGKEPAAQEYHGPREK